MASHRQVPGEEIDVASWRGDDEHPFFPEGSRDKQLLRCPDPAPCPWLVPGHRYLFKQSRHTYPEQFWAEVVASRLSRHVGVEVPPAYAGWNSDSGLCGALIEWFYGKPEEGDGTRFVHGGNFMKAAIDDFDHVKGRQHNFQTVSNISRALLFRGRHDLTEADRRQRWIDAWANMLAFDALIGNTDRHQENWGVLLTKNSDGILVTRLSPAFDNGTSMGHELVDKHFNRYADPTELARYIDRGRHHMKLRLSDARRKQHGELLVSILAIYPEARDTMLAVLDVTKYQLRDAVLPLTQLKLPVPLSPDRAELMLSLLVARRERLVAQIAEA